MKTILGLFLITFSLAAEAASVGLQTNVTPNNTELVISLKRDEVFTEKLIDALLKSPLVEEVRNEWTRPKTQYKGDGFFLDLNHFENGWVELQIIQENQGIRTLSSSTLFSSAVVKTGAMRNFHQALLASKSPFVLSRQNPGRLVRPQDGEAVVLEADSFIKKSISCSFAFRDTSTTICSFKLTLNR